MIVDTYEKLGVFIDRWVAGTIDLLIVESAAGLGKTSLVKEKLRGMPHLAINSHATTLSTYKQLYYHKDQLLWFDDVTFLLISELNISLMKQVCDSQIVKQVSYFTSSSLIDDVPCTFQTRSKVLITCNSLDKDNAHMRALKDRAFYIQFKPTRSEILAKIREVSTKYDKLSESEKNEVLSVIETHSPNLTRLSLRSLVKGFQLYKYYALTGEPWLNDLLSELGLNPKLIRLNELMTNANYKSDVDRLKDWNWSKQTFYAYKKELDKTEEIQNVEQTN